MLHPLAPPEFEDNLISQRMLKVGVGKLKWIRTLRLCCHELVAWLPSESASDWGISYAVFLLTHPKM